MRCLRDRVAELRRRFREIERLLETLVDDRRRRRRDGELPESRRETLRRRRVLARRLPALVGRLRETFQLLLGALDRGVRPVLSVDLDPERDVTLHRHRITSSASIGPASSGGPPLVSRLSLDRARRERRPSTPRTGEATPREGSCSSRCTDRRCIATKSRGEWTWGIVANGRS